MTESPPEGEGVNNVSQQSSPPIQTRPPSAIDNASFISRLLWRWPYPLIALGITRPLNTLDMPEITPSDSSVELGNMFDRIVEDAIQDGVAGKSLLKGIFYHYVKR